ncbi:sugar phosphate isomerase/epimerase [Chloroflexi bacterium TSY]|nr:sugar phosphate isomerase/epimerase [Chloroflexi bacterium TSY]
MTDWTKRLAIVSDEASESFVEAIRICLPLGIQAYELRRFGGARFPYVPDDAIKEVVSLVLQYDLTLVGVSPGFFKGSMIDSQAASEFTEGFPHAFRLMERLGVRQMTVFSYLRDEPISGQAVTMGENLDVPQQVLDQLGRAVELCQKEGINMVIENGADCWGNTGKHAAALAQTLGVQLTWDPANAAASGEIAFPDGYEHVRSLITHVHCKNWSTTNGNVALDAGVVDWKAQLSALELDGYRGYYCVEPHQWHDRANATRLNTRQLVRLLEEVERNSR